MPEKPRGEAGFHGPFPEYRMSSRVSRQQRLCIDAKENAAREKRKANGQSIAETRTKTASLSQRRSDLLQYYPKRVGFNTKRARKRPVNCEDQIQHKCDHG